MNHDIVTISAAHDIILSLSLWPLPLTSGVTISSSGDGYRRGDIITDIANIDLMRELRIMSVGALDTVNSDRHQHTSHPVKSSVYNLGITEKRETLDQSLF